MLTQIFWDVILQVGGHEELEAFIINGLHEKEIATDLFRYTYNFDLHQNRDEHFFLHKKEKL